MGPSLPLGARERGGTVLVTVATQEVVAAL